MHTIIDREVGNLCDRKLWDIVRLSEIVATDSEFLAQVRREIGRRQCHNEAHRLRRYLFSAALVDEYGRETPITESMINQVCGPAVYAR
jgi:hypothetical protein